MTTDAHPQEPSPVQRVAVEGLRRRVTIRERLDHAHVRRLAGILDRCPPIVVTPDGAIIDGEHRVEAARLRGRQSIPAIVVRLSSATAALIAAVEANALHGLPLTRDERRAALDALLAADPRVSDRRLAVACGVSRRVVEAARAEACSGGAESHLNSRVGADGKQYPAARRRAWRQELEARLRLEPGRSVRDLAGQVGMSVGSVHPVHRAVRARIARERRFVRWIKRLRARWLLRRLTRSLREDGDSRAEAASTRPPPETPESQDV